MDTYAFYFGALVLFNSALLYHRHQQSSKIDRKEETLASPAKESGKEEAWKFKITYFSCYVLVYAGEWLQGPYMYTMYRDERGLSEKTVAALFTTGFISAGVAASFVGSLADKHGRRLACLTYCVAYSLSCLSVLSTDVMVLFVGRALGGLSTTLLYTVFDAWMLAEFNFRGLSDCLSSKDMFSLSTTLSGVVAIIAGVVGETAVAYTGTRSAPFMVAACCLGLAFMGISKYWGENYGEEAKDPEKATAANSPQPAALMDKRILTSAFAMTIFEGSMYLFVFFWSPALKSARAASGSTEPLPFGLVFSCFMCAMMLGSLAFSNIELRTERDTGRLLLSILALAANAMLIPVLTKAEAGAFWSFALFEVCVGLYWPCMNKLKEALVDDAVRARVYGQMRLPLNAFVVVVLGITREGDAYRNMVFTAVAALLLGGFLVVQRYL